MSPSISAVMSADESIQNRTVFVCENASSTASLSAVLWPLQSSKSSGHVFLPGSWFQASTVSIDRLKPVLGPVLGPQKHPWRDRPPSSALISPPMVQDPGWSLSGTFCLDLLHLRWDMLGTLVPVIGPSLLLLVWFPPPGPVLETVSAPVCRNPLPLARGVLPTPSSTPSAPCRSWRWCWGGAL